MQAGGWLRRTLTAAVLLLTLTASVSQAQEQEPALSEVREIQQELTSIQDSVLAGSPALQAQVRALQDLVRQTMEEAGFDPVASIARLRQLELEFESLSPEDPRRTRIFEEAGDIQADLQQGQQMALRDAAVIAGQQALESDLLQAMREEAPHTDELLDRFDELRARMEEQSQ